MQIEEVGQMGSGCMQVTHQIDWRPTEPINSIKAHLEQATNLCMTQERVGAEKQHILVLPQFSVAPSTSLKCNDEAEHKNE